MEMNKKVKYVHNISDWENTHTCMYCKIRHRKKEKEK